MKKKIGIILLAVLLCVVLVFTCVACKKKTTTTEDSTTGTISQADKDQMFAKVGAYLDSWLSANAQEEGYVTNQTKALKSDLKSQNSSFSLTDSKKKKYTPSYNIAFKNNVYTIEVVWSADTKTTFTKNAQTDKYENWAGRNSRPDDDWLIESGVPSESVDAIVAAGVDTVNYITGNAITGKFGADGVIGVSVAGKTYGLRIKGNLDGTENGKTNNEVGLVIVDGDMNEIAGIYYKAAATAQASKLYFQYSSTGPDGKLIRENGEIVYTYRYLDYADIYSLIEGFLPKDKKYDEANDGVLQFEDDFGAVKVDGLASLFSAAFGIDASIANVVINTIAKSYEHEGRYYIDINLGRAINEVKNLTSTIDLSKVSILNDLHINPSELSGLKGHITLSAKINDQTINNEKKKILSDFELAVNIPKCEFSLNNDPEHPLKFKIPAISFALYIEDFSFLTSEKVRDVIPAEALATTDYFSPTNIDISGDVHVLHEEGGVKKHDATYHYELMTDINVFEVIENKYESNAKAALVIMQSPGNVYDKDNATNFFSISYDQHTRTLAVSGTAFNLDDYGNQVYTFSMADKDAAIAQIKTWLGIDNWQGVGLDEEHGIYINDANIAKASALALLDNDLAEDLMKYFIEKLFPKEDAGESEAVGEVAEAGFDMSKIGDYFSAFKELYNEYVEAGKIDIGIKDGAPTVKVEVTKAMIHDVIDAINATFGVSIPKPNDPEFVNVYINSGNFEGGAYIGVKYDGNLYEFTVKGGFSFKYTNTKNRVYEFKYTAESTTFSFEVKDAQGNRANYTEVGLSGFTAHWGRDNKNKITDLMLDTTDVQPIFPADGTGPATQLVSGLMGLLNGEKVKPYAEEIGEFIIRQLPLEKIKKALFK